MNARKAKELSEKQEKADKKRMNAHVGHLIDYAERQRRKVVRLAREFVNEHLEDDVKAAIKARKRSIEYTEYQVSEDVLKRIAEIVHTKYGYDYNWYQYKRTPTDVDDYDGPLTLIIRW